MTAAETNAHESNPVTSCCGQRSTRLAVFSPIDIRIDGRIDERAGQHKVHQQQYHAQRKAVLDQPQVKEGGQTAPVGAQKGHCRQDGSQHCERR